MAPNSARLLNISLRFGTLGVRFMFVFFLAKYLDAASIGYYGLFTATIGYFMYFVGMDFYVYVTREILSVSNEQRGQMVKGQAVLSGLLYLAVLPFAAVFLAQASWPPTLLLWFFPILILEHFNQEVYRLLVVLSQQISASILLFIRQGSWAIGVAALMNWEPGNRSLDTVMALWACAGITAALFGIWKLKQLQMGGWRQPVNWRWVRKGIAISAAFLVATLALRGMQTFDRYWLQSLADIETVGAYVLFFGIASALLVFLDAAVFSFAYPALIGHHHQAETVQARVLVKQMGLQTLAVSLAFAVISWIALPYLLSWVGNPIYQNALGLFPWILAATMINAISMVPHYALYARGQNRSIIWSHITALPVFALSTWAISAYNPVVAVPAGLLTAFGLILVWKTIAYLMSMRLEARANLTPDSLQK